MAPAPPSAPRSGVELTSAADGLAHRVSDVDHAGGLAAGHGWFRAACGVAVLASSLTTAPGRRCPACTDAVAAPPVRRGRLRRTGRGAHRIAWRP